MWSRTPACALNTNGCKSHREVYSQERAAILRIHEPDPQDAVAERKVMSILIVPVNAGDHMQGSNDAQVTLIEYGEYQCPYCGEAFPIVKHLQKEMAGDLRFIFRNFPLTEIHAHALAAAQAAEAAALQDRFWEMHDMLYENQDKLRDRDLNALAQKLKV